MSAFDEVWKSFADRGYHPDNTAGVVANLVQESNLNPTAVNPKSGAFGIAQWLGPRKKALFRYAAETQRAPTDLGTQIEFMHNELDTTHADAKKALLSSNGPGDSAVAFSDNFEKAGEDEKNNPRRVALATSIAGQVPDSDPPSFEEWKAMQDQQQQGQLQEQPQGDEPPSFEQWKAMQQQSEPQQAEAPQSKQVSWTPLGSLSNIEPRLKELQHGLVSKFEGLVGQPLLNAMGDPEVAGEYKRRVDTYEGNFRKDHPGYTGGELLSDMMIPLGGPAKSIAGLAGRGALSALMQPVVGSDTYWGNKGIQAATGAAMAPVLSAATSALMGEKGGLERSLPTAVQDLKDLGKKWKVRLSIGDLAKSDWASKTEQLLKAVPFSGMTEYGEKQGAEVTNLVSNLEDRFNTKMSGLKYTSQARIVAAANSGNKEAMDVVQMMKNAGNDPDLVMQASGRARLMNAKLNTGELYDKVERLAGDAPVPLRKSTNYLDNAIDELSKARSVNRPLIAHLSQVRNDITNSNALQTFGATRQLRSDIGSMISDAKSGSNALLGKQGIGYLSKLKSKVEQDMVDHIHATGNPELLRAWKAADSYNRNVTSKFKEADIVRDLTTLTPDEVFNRNVKPGKTDRTTNFTGFLDTKGRAALQAKTIDEAKLQALKPNKTGVSSKQFADYLQKRNKPLNAIYKGQDRRDIGEVTKLLSHTEKTGPTILSNKLQPWTWPTLGLATLYGHAGLAGVGLGIANLTRRAMTSPAAPNAFMSHYGINPDAQMINDIIARLGSPASHYVGE